MKEKKLNALKLINIASIVLLIILAALLSRRFAQREKTGNTALQTTNTSQARDNKQGSSGNITSILFANALRFKKNADYKQAISKLKEAIEENPKSYLADNAYYQIADMLNSQKMRHYAQAVEVCRLIVRDYPQSELADDAQYVIADTMHTKLKDVGTAMKEYEKFLAMFPESKYSAEIKGRQDLLNSDPEGDGITIAQAIQRGLPDENFELLVNNEEQGEVTEEGKELDKILDGVL